MSNKTDASTITIKKYANRRLYNTGTSTYVTLEDLASMVKKGDDFHVVDAKSNDDITHQVLTQIIFEQENKGQNLLPINFLRQLIRFYGDSIQGFVPKYLELSMSALTREQDKVRGPLKAFGAPAPFQSAVEEQMRTNVALMERAFRMFTMFPAQEGAAGEEAAAPQQAAASTPAKSEDLDDLRREMAEMRARLDKVTSKG